MTGAGHTIDEMVFENRNKEYGSYQLRKKYPLRLAIGFSASLLFVTLITLGYFFFLKEAGDETIYMIQGDSPYLKTVQTSLLSQEEIDAYSGGKEKTEEPVEIPAEKPSANPVRNFIVSEEAISDTFTAVDEKPDVADEDLDAEQIDKIYDTYKKFFADNPSWSLFMVTTDKDVEDRIFGRKADRRRKLYNGRLEVCYYQFHGKKE